MPINWVTTEKKKKVGIGSFPKMAQKGPVLVFGNSEEPAIGSD